jgi:hypothetical protein
LDVASDADWCELIRDVVAVANSGGGRIVVDGAIDEPQILSRLRQFTDSTFDDIHVQAIERNGAELTLVNVGAATIPVGFTKPGVCDSTVAPDGPQQVFPLGVYYFRHGERSEPGTSGDMRAFIERLLRRVRRRWLRGIRRVLAKPITFDEGAAPKRIVSKRIRLERTVLQPVRIVSDPNAPALQPQDVDRLYPWRQKDLLHELNNRLGRRVLTTYDVQAVRRHHGLDERLDFVFHLPGAGRRYSPAVADWIMEQFGRDPEFFHEARAADQAMLKLRRKKPR